jgi:putative membrane protein
MSSEDRAVGEPERLHPLFLLTGLGGSLRGVAGGYAFIGYLAFTGRASTAILAASALLVFLAASLFVYWRRFEYRVGDNEIRIDSGIISRTHRSIPFDRIQDVDITQGPVARLLGLAKVKFETGGSAAGGDEEGVLQAIALERAQELRTLVRAQRAGHAPRAADTSEAEAHPVFTMDTGRVLLAGVFNFSLALLAGLFGFTQTFGDFAGFDPLNRTFWTTVLNRSDPIANYILAHRIAAAVAGAVLLVLIGLATGVVRTTLREYGFRLDRTDVGLRRRRGLLTRTDVTLPVRRAQAAIVGSGPLRAMFGWNELHLQSLARDEGGKGDHVLAPLAREDEIGTIVRELGWRPLPDLVDWRRISRAHVWTLAIGLSPLILIVGLVVATLGLAPLIIGDALGGAEAAELKAPFFSTLAVLIGLVAAIAVRWFSWKRTAYALDDDRLLIRSGWWRRRLVILPFNRIQSADVRESFVSRWFGVASLRFGVAGGSGYAAHFIPALPRETARELRRELLI